MPQIAGIEREESTSPPAKRVRGHLQNQVFERLRRGLMVGATKG